MGRRARTVSGALVQALSRVAERGGVERERFLRETGLAGDGALAPGARVAADKYQRALALAEWAEGRAPASPEVLTCLEEGLPLLLAAWLNAPTVGAALAAFGRYLPVFAETDHVHVAQDGDRARVTYQTDLPAPHAAFAALGCFLPLIHVVRAYEPGRGARFALELPQRARGCGSFLEDALGERVTVGQRCVLAISGVDLRAEHGRHNPALNPLLARTLSETLADLEREPTLSQTVERALARSLAAAPGQPGRAELWERLCADLQVSRATLKRRLAEEGTSLRSLRLRACGRAAARLLEDTDLSVVEIGERVGFTSRTSFHHFFRRVMGEAPGAWRERTRALAERPG